MLKDSKDAEWVDFESFGQVKNFYFAGKNTIILNDSDRGAYLKFQKLPISGSFFLLNYLILS